MPPFEKGHAYLPPAHSERGLHAPRQKAGRILAAAIRESVPAEAIVAWLVTVWQGRDPLTGEQVALADRREALKTLLERGYGTPAQHVVIDAQIQAALSRELPDASDAMEELDDETLLKLERLGIGLPVLDAESH